MWWKWFGLVIAALCLALPAVAEQDKNKEPEQYIKVEVKGILRTGVAAIGGETTGTIITAKGITWELDFGKNKKLREQAEKLDGETVVVTGTLELRKGVEIPQRLIVTVTHLKPAKEKPVKEK